MLFVCVRAYACVCRSNKIAICEWGWVWALYSNQCVTIGQNHQRWAWLSWTRWNVGIRNFNSYVVQSERCSGCQLRRTTGECIHSVEYNTVLTMSCLSSVGLRDARRTPCLRQTRFLWCISSWSPWPAKCSEEEWASSVKVRIIFRWIFCWLLHHCHVDLFRFYVWLGYFRGPCNILSSCSTRKGYI
jgi:hypothetical protein